METWDSRSDSNVLNASYQLPMRHYRSSVYRYVGAAAADVDVTARVDRMSIKDIVMQYAEQIGSRLFSLFLRALVPVGTMIVLLCLISGISILWSIYIRRALVPKALIHERVYFNYVYDPPRAQVNLLSANKQWNYINSRSGGAAATTVLGRSDESNADELASSYEYVKRDRARFLKTDSEYDIHGVFIVAKSDRNFDIGSAAVTLNMVDSSGEVVARSVRPIVMPYQSPTSLFLEAVTLFPCRLLCRALFMGLQAVGGGRRSSSSSSSSSRYAAHSGVGGLETTTATTIEAVQIWLDLMDGYREPVANMPATEVLELILHTPPTANAHTLDVISAYVTVMPRLSGLVYYLYYYPWFSFVGTWAVAMVIQITSYSSIAMFVIVLRYVYAMLYEEETGEEEEEEEEEGGGGGGGNTSSAGRRWREYQQQQQQQQQLHRQQQEERQDAHYANDIPDTNSGNHSRNSNTSDIGRDSNDNDNNNYRINDDDDDDDDDDEEEEEEEEEEEGGGGGGGAAAAV